ncbi:MAG: hypothetical protein WAV16_02495 [Candidatus Moraniibacteriota bacterium]
MNKKNQESTKNDIMRELGFDKLPEDKQDDILAKIGEIILKKIFIETIDRLDDDDGKKLKEMLKNGDNPEEIEEFLRARIEKYDMIIERIVENVKTELKNS